MPNKRNIWSRLFQRAPAEDSPTYKEPEKVIDGTVVSPGRVSVPNDSPELTVRKLQGLTNLITPSYRQDLIPLIRDLYKINPDVSIALQDMFKLSNTAHRIDFPNNTTEEARKMRLHLREASKRWSRYSAGMPGLINRMICQIMVGGALSTEAVPNTDLTGLSTILFINPEDIRFERENNGVYPPYQLNRFKGTNDKPQYIKLNTATYIYVGI